MAWHKMDIISAWQPACCHPKSCLRNTTWKCIEKGLIDDYKSESGRSGKSSCSAMIRNKPRLVYPLIAEWLTRDCCIRKTPALTRVASSLPFSIILKCAVKQLTKNWMRSLRSPNILTVCYAVPPHQNGSKRNIRHSRERWKYKDMKRDITKDTL